MSTIFSNYLGDNISRLASTLKRYGPPVLAQHIDDDKYVVVAAVETWVRMHLDDISLPEVIVSSNYDAP